MASASAPRAASAALTLAVIAISAGMISPRHAEFAQRADDPHAASCVLLALLLEASAADARAALLALFSAADAAHAAHADTVPRQVLLNLAQPAVKQQPASARRGLLDNVMRAIARVRHCAVFEFVPQYRLREHLADARFLLC